MGVPLKKTASSLHIGKAEEIKKGDKTLSIWALGDFVQVACRVAQSIESKFNLSCAVANARFVKPMDETLLFDHAQKYTLLSPSKIMF